MCTLWVIDRWMTLWRDAAVMWKVRLEILTMSCLIQLSPCLCTKILKIQPLSVSRNAKEEGLAVCGLHKPFWLITKCLPLEGSQCVVVSCCKHVMQSKWHFAFKVFVALLSGRLRLHIGSPGVNCECVFVSQSTRTIKHLIVKQTHGRDEFLTGKHTHTEREVKHKLLTPGGTTKLVVGLAKKSCGYRHTHTDTLLI